MDSEEGGGFEPDALHNDPEGDELLVLGAGEAEAVAGGIGGMDDSGQGSMTEAEFQQRIAAMGDDQRRPYDIVRRQIRRNRQRAADLVLDRLSTDLLDDPCPWVKVAIHSVTEAEKLLLLRLDPCDESRDVLHLLGNEREESQRCKGERTQDG